MAWQINDYFESWPEEFTDLLLPFSPPWKVIERIRDKVKMLVAEASNSFTTNKLHEFLAVDENPGTAPSIYVQSTFRTSEPIVIPRLNIFIGSGTRLERTAIIQENTYIGDGCDIRQAAYLRGNVILGPKCVAGHTTEIKNSVLIKHVEAGHFSYIGDSVIGSYVNMGAGSILANLNFRTLEQKKNDTLAPSKIQSPQGSLVEGPAKFGSVLGDGVEMGCNCVVAPGTFLGYRSKVMPCLFLRKGAYPPDSFLKNDKQQFL